MAYNIEEFNINNRTAYLSGVDISLSDNALTLQPASCISVNKKLDHIRSYVNFVDPTAYINGYFSPSDGISHRSEDYDLSVVNTKYMRVLSNTTYLIKGNPSLYKIVIYFYDIDLNYLSHIWYNEISEFTTPDNTAYIRIGLREEGLTTELIVADIYIVENTIENLLNDVDELYEENVISKDFPLIKELYINGVSEYTLLRLQQLINNETSHYIHICGVEDYDVVVGFYERGLAYSDSLVVWESAAGGSYIVVDWDNVANDGIEGMRGSYLINMKKSTTLSSNPIIASYLSSKKSEIISWILSDSYQITDATYTNGVINSPVSVIFPDNETGTIIIKRNTSKEITSLEISYKNMTFTYSITRDEYGNIIKTNII